MPNSNPKDKPLPERLAGIMPILTVVIAVLYAAAAYAVLILPKLNVIAAGGGLDAAALAGRIEQETGYSTSLVQANTKFEALNPQRRQKIENILPSTPATQDLFVILDEIARGRNMVLTSIDTAVDEKEVQVDGRKTVRVSINVAGGDYEQFKAFVRDLEVSERIFDVQTLVFSPGATSYDIALRAYYFDPEAAQPARRTTVSPPEGEAGAIQ